MHTVYPFRFGQLLLTKRSDKLISVKYHPLDADLSGIERNPRIFKTETDLLDKYFQGKNPDFSVLKLDFSTASSFQRKVWSLARKIPYGSTVSYKHLAEKIGHKGYRSIGQALHRNPWLIVVPCHRVVRCNGGLGGFGAGLQVKKYLLDLEKK